MTEVEFAQSTWKDDKSPLSYWNVPQAVKTTQGRSDPMTGYVNPITTPTIKQLYDTNGVKQLPGKGLKGKGQFVDWGTKLYELELELSYKNNEIVVLEKKLKKFSDILYPGGNTTKKSIVSRLQDQNAVVQKKLETKERQYKWEQKRANGLQKDLADVKKQNLELRRRHLVNEKAVQTIPITNKDTQVSLEPKTSKMRTVMTQCAPTVLKVTNSTRVTTKPDTPECKSTVTHRRVYRSLGDKPPSSNGSPYTSTTNVRAKLSPRFASKKVTVENKVDVEAFPESPEGHTTLSVVPAKKSVPYAPSHSGVKFATSMTIKETAERRKESHPLDMTITQEFGKENTVKTVVHSNKDFEIREKPVVITSSGQAIEGMEQISQYQKLKGQSADADSGVSSYESENSPVSFRTSPLGSPSSRSGRFSYKQILDGASHQTHEGDVYPNRVYERNMKEYLRPSSPRYSRPTSANAWDIYHREAQISPNGMVPYYMFRRSHENVDRNRAVEKPIFVHVSEITMNR